MTGMVGRRMPETCAQGVGRVAVDFALRVRDGAKDMAPGGCWWQCWSHAPHAAHDHYLQTVNAAALCVRGALGGAARGCDGVAVCTM